MTRVRVARPHARSHPRARLYKRRRLTGAPRPSADENANESPSKTASREVAVATRRRVHLLPNAYASRDALDDIYVDTVGRHIIQTVDRLSAAAAEPIERPPLLDDVPVVSRAYHERECLRTPDLERGERACCNGAKCVAVAQALHVINVGGIFELLKSRNEHVDYSIFALREYVLPTATASEEPPPRPCLLCARRELTLAYHEAGEAAARRPSNWWRVIVDQDGEYASQALLPVSADTDGVPLFGSIVAYCEGDYQYERLERGGRVRQLNVGFRKPSACEAPSHSAVRVHVPLPSAR